MRLIFSNTEFHGTICIDWYEYFAPNYETKFRGQAMISFFVSSTFKDMQGERDTLHYQVMPQIREFAEEYYQSVEFVDLRWGISTEDAESGTGDKRILEVCLREIKDCKPYMIILLGERYGWMPPAELVERVAGEAGFCPDAGAMSVTELEIRYGTWLNKGELDHCIFCLRSDIDMEKLPEEQKAIYQSGSEEDAERMRRLKNLIRSNPSAHIIDYSLEWDAEQNHFSGYSEFAQRLADSLCTMLQQQWGEKEEEHWLKKQWLKDNKTNAEKSKAFYGRNNELKLCIDYIRTRPLLIIQGDSGSGKSALMSRLKDQMSSSGFQAQIVYCGLSKECMTVRQLVEIMLLRLTSRYVPAGWPDEERLFQTWYRAAAEYDEEEMVIFVDAIDQLAADGNLYYSRFLPPKLSPKLHLVVSTNGNAKIATAKLAPKKDSENGLFYSQVVVSKPDEQDLKEIAEGHFTAAHKKASKVVIEEILKNLCSQNMLGLEIICRRLITLDAEDFTKISELEKRMSGEEAINTFLIQLVQNMSHNLDDLVNEFIDFICGYGNSEEKAFRTIVLYNIAICCHGISKYHLYQISEAPKHIEAIASMKDDKTYCGYWDDLKFANLKRFLGDFLIEGEDGSIEWTHRLFRNAMRNRFGSGNIAISVGIYLKELPMDDLLRYENLLMLARLCYNRAEDEENEQNIIDRANLAYYYAIDDLTEAGAMSDNSDEQIAAVGKERLNTIAQNVMAELGSDSDGKVVKQYRQLIQEVIAYENIGPSNWLCYFLMTKIAIPFGQLSTRNKCISLELMTTMVDAFKKRIEKEFPKDWSPYDYRLLMIRCGNAIVNYNKLSAANEVGVVRKLDLSLSYKELVTFMMDYGKKVLALQPDNYRFAGSFAHAYANSLYYTVNWKQWLYFGSYRCVREIMGILKKYEVNPEESRSNYDYVYSLIITGVSRGLYLKYYNRDLFRTTGKITVRNAMKYINEGLEYYKTVAPGFNRDYGLLTLQFERYRFTINARGKKAAENLPEELDTLWEYYDNIWTNHDSDKFDRGTRELLVKVAVSLALDMIGNRYPSRFLEKDDAAKQKEIRKQCLGVLIEREALYVRNYAMEDTNGLWTSLVFCMAQCILEQNKKRFLEYCDEAFQYLETLEKMVQEKDKKYDVFRYLDSRYYSPGTLAYYRRLLTHWVELNRPQESAQK